MKPTLYVHSLLASTIIVNLAFSAQAQAQQIDSVATELVTCSFMQDQSERLSCYEVLARKTQRMLQRKSEQQVVTPVVPPSDTISQAPATTQSTKTSNHSTSSTEPDSSSVLTVTLTSAKRDPRGDWLLYFENGEVWKQIDTRRRRMPELPAKATITIGGFGSHRLRVEGRSWSMKIKQQ